MAASPVGVDGVAEREAGLLGDVVDDAARLHLQELEAAVATLADAQLRPVVE
jgi:hypothetical protein